MAFTPTVKRFLRHVGYQSRRGILPFRQVGFSCFSEERVLEKYIAELLPEGHCRTAVDIGAGDGRTGSNTLALFKRGWKGLGVEWNSRKAYKLAKTYQRFCDVSSCRLRVTPDNVLSLLRMYSVEKSFSVLNIDIDSYDYWVLDAILSDYRPGIVITEINEKIPPPMKFKVKYDPDFQLREHFYGYSIACLDELCTQRGYALIDLEYNNAFLAPIELAGARALSAESAYRRGYLERPDRREKFPRNENMEILHYVSSEEGMRFLRKFFSKLAGRYELSVAPSPNDCAINSKRMETP
jgi:hypothetical protein